MALSNGRIHAFSCALAILATITGKGLQAQTESDCSLRGQDTVLATGVVLKKCLDLTGLDGKNVVIPANVVRIDNTGFSLCESSEQEGGLADIVYVMDQSGSMGINYIWISPDGLDTLLIENLDGCKNITAADTRGFGTVTLPNGAGTRQVTRVNPAKSPAGCYAPSGDPYTQRAIAFKEAIDFQAARAPNSTAGFVGFAANVVNSARPLKLNSQANINKVQKDIAPQLVGGTNYKAPLDTAKKWLLSPAISANPTKAVIFLSDGKPTGNDSNSYINVLDPAYAPLPGVMPPIYGIFLGKPVPDTLKLSDLSKRTGGQFFIIPPNRPDSLKAVVARILNVILRQYQPNSASLTNSTLAPPQTGSATATDFVRQDDGGWLMNLDQAVGLKALSPNQISLLTELRETNTGALKPRTTAFTLSTTGPKESANRNLPGTQFSVVCKELPPVVDPIKVAYIRDTDGDGAGDKVFFVFTRPLPALPSAIDTVYWNRVAPGFLNGGKPKLSFLIGSNNTVVIADFTASPFIKGLTSIPTGQNPIGVLPMETVFGGQRPPINDSIGPIIDSAIARPFDNAKVAPGAELNLDTLVVYISEGMMADNTWNNLILVSKPVNGQCTDFINAKLVTPYRQPTLDADKKTVTFVLQNGQGATTPISGDCVFLNVDGSYTDNQRNIPAIHGEMIRGARPAREIEVFRGYPPVVGVTADKPGFVLANNDARKGTETDYSNLGANGKYVTQWIPPVGFTENIPFFPLIPKSAATASVGADNLDQAAIPKAISTIQVVSTGKYIADVSIFDNKGYFVKTFKQAFGYQGELNNQNRITKKGLVSYLVWDLKDQHGQKAAQGVFIWKVVFQFENNKEEIQYTRTGVIRNPDWFLSK